MSKSGNEFGGRMRKPARYHDLFDCDVREAASWYCRRSSQAAEAFVDAVEARVREVINAPEQFSRAFDEVRFARVLRFPYIILFESDSDELRIYGVLHSASDPEKWRDRAADVGS